MQNGFSVNVTLLYVMSAIRKNNTRSRQHNTANAQRLQDMFYPLLNKQTGEAWCVGNEVEYHKLQYLKMSDSAHIWIPSWKN